MPQLVVLGAKIQCSMAIPPAPVGSLVVLPTNKVAGLEVPAANIMDNKPFANIPPFPLCNSIANPTVAAATSAAMGVLTPSACVPVFPGPWTPGATKATVGGMPALHSGCTLMCAYGGVVSVGYAGQAKIDVT